MKILFVILITSLSICGSTLFSAPYAAIVMNAKNGKILHCEECDTKLHPAGLTKLLTLYIVFSKIENGERRLVYFLFQTKAPNRLFALHSRCCREDFVICFCNLLFNFM